MKNKGINFTKELDLCKVTLKEVVKYYADGIRDGYLVPLINTYQHHSKQKSRSYVCWFNSW